MYVLIHPIQIKAGYKEQYVKELVEVSSASVNTEPGLLRLNVIQDAADSNRVWVYAIFKDQAALDIHKTHPLVNKFRDVTKGWRDEESDIQGAGLGAYNIWPPDSEII
jgi:autoinducer 2-degrading protein